MTIVTSTKLLIAGVLVVIGGAITAVIAVGSFISGVAVDKWLTDNAMPRYGRYPARPRYQTMHPPSATGPVESSET